MLPKKYNLLYGASQILCGYIAPKLLTYQKEGLNSNEKKLLKDCIKALEVLGFDDLYYQYNKRFEAIEDARKPEYKVFKNGVHLKTFNTLKDAETFYYELQPFTSDKEKLEIIEYIKE